jgi:uncharacterized 2Fe-2S/4Fe-4S cluster protein (DUF4445 family)
MKSHSVIFTPSGVRGVATDADSVLDVALAAGVDIQSICGGKGLCKRCQIELVPGEHAKLNVNIAEQHLSPLSATEKKAIADGELALPRRLACRAKIRGDVVIDVPSEAREVESSIRKESTHFETELNPAVTLHMCQLPVPTLEDNPVDGEALREALLEFGVTAKPNHRVLTKLQPILAAHGRTLIAVVRDQKEIIDVWPPSPFNLYGAAIDIGSTSIAIYVYDLSRGVLVYEAAAMNPQIRFGEDLMSRVSYIMMNKGGAERLTQAIRTQIEKMLGKASLALGLGPNQLLEVVMVGNPIMHHLFLGISPVELGQAPFTLAVKDWLDLPARGFDLGLSDAARISFFPLVGGHVGADTTAAYLTQMDAMKGRSVLLVDIGTNAEIVLSHKGRVATASSPTGPAFEGAEISAGVRASPGAIERVRIDQQTKEPVFKIIGHDEWLADRASAISSHNIIGICGSGIFEVMVELASAGLIDKGGLFRPQQAPNRFVEEGKSWKYLLVNQPDNPIYIKQTDVRAVQLAKAALNAGVALLADYLGCEEFDEVLLAGAFGTHLDSKFVADIGIIANASASIIRSVGNAAGMGAAMVVMNVDEKARIIEAVKHIEKMETATQQKFQEYFIAAMKFPTAPAVAEGSGGARRRRRRGRIKE